MEALSADEKQSANDLVASATEAIASVKATMDAAVAAHAMLVEQEADQKAKQAIEAKADNVATSPDGSQTQVKLSDVLTAVMLGEKTQMIMAEEGGGEQTVLQYSSAEGLTQGSQYMVRSKMFTLFESPPSPVTCHLHLPHTYRPQPRPFSHLSSLISRLSPLVSRNT
jgi:hypothetical protein